MKEFKDLKFEKRKDGMGITSKIEFDNGFGASVIKGPYTYGGEDDLYELAVIKDGSIQYYTSVTDDVEGHLTKERVTELLIEIQELKRK